MYMLRLGQIRIQIAYARFRVLRFAQHEGKGGEGVGGHTSWVLVASKGPGEDSGQWRRRSPQQRRRETETPRERERGRGSGGRERNGLGEPGLRSVVVGEAGPAQPGFVPPHARVTLANA